MTAQLGRRGGVRRRTRATPGGRRRERKALRNDPGSAILRDMKTPEYSYVAVLRAAHPDTPTVREVGRAMGVTGSLVSAFEIGRYELTPDKLAAYAKAIGHEPEEVRGRWLRQAAYYHATKLRTIRELLISAGKGPKHRGAPGHTRARKKNVSVDKARARA